MAEIYRYVQGGMDSGGSRGTKLEKFVAKMPEVQFELAVKAAEYAGEANALLNEARARSRWRGTRTAKFTTSHGKIDYYVNLDDPATARNNPAAIAIEEGRTAGTTNRGGASHGLHILSKVVKGAHE